MSRNWDYIAKIVMIGDSACGKSSLTIRLTDGKFSDLHDVTIAAEIGSKVLKVGESNKMKLQIWDTAGQEHFRAVTRSYFRNAAGCILVYDISRRETFNHAQEWLNDIKEQTDSNISICLVGNKLDLAEENRQVTYDEASQWAQEAGITEFVETSAKTGEKVLEAYQLLAQEIYHKIEDGKFDLQNKQSGVKANTTGLINLNMETQPSENKGCCS